jgi:7-cyano-7-deazaguanine synthase
MSMPAEQFDLQADPACLNSLASVAVLVSGGLDSAILLGEALEECARVHPVYIRSGHPWEAAEAAVLRRFLDRIERPGLKSLVVLDMPITDLYANHWSLTPESAPPAGTPDEDVYLPGRNVLLLAKGMLWCHLHDVEAIALAVLRANPFPDATPMFFRRFQEAVNQGVEGKVRVLRPYVGLKKKEILKRAVGLPLECTLSCMNSCTERHCGRCSKCAERQDAFRDAGLADPTSYGMEDKCTG